MQDPSNEELRLDTERLHEELAQSGDYQTLKETGDQQVEYLKALDFMDTIGPKIRIFNVCRAKSKWDFKKEVACSCGLAYPSKLWLQPDKTRWKWVCSLDWKELIKAQEQFPHNEDLGTWVKDLKEKYGSVENWPKIGCHANFVPWKTGASQVVELMAGNGEWQSCMAERMPQELDDAIKGHHAKFYMAQKELTPQELLDVLPVSFPVTHNVKEFPGVSNYPVDAWEDAGSPMLSVTGWIKLCVRIAKQNMVDLHTVFEVAQKLNPEATKEAVKEASDESATPRSTAASSSTTQVGK